MSILGFRRPHKDLRISLRALRDQGIAVSGPYRRHDGTLVLSIAGRVLMEDELVHLQREGKLDAKSIRDLLDRG
jgi:hypothetical protein